MVYIMADAGYNEKGCEHSFGMLYVPWMIGMGLPISIFIICYLSVKEVACFQIPKIYFFLWCVFVTRCIMRLMLEIMSGGVEVLALAIYLAWFMSPLQIRMRCMHNAHCALWSVSPRWSYTAVHCTTLCGLHL